MPDFSSTPSSIYKAGRHESSWIFWISAELLCYVHKKHLAVLSKSSATTRWRHQVATQAPIRKAQLLFPKRDRVTSESLPTTTTEPMTLTTLSPARAERAGMRGTMKSHSGQGQRADMLPWGNDLPTFLRKRTVRVPTVFEA